MKTQLISPQQIADRLPIELVPEKITKTSVLSALSKLKEERNNYRHKKPRQEAG